MACDNSQFDFSLAVYLRTSGYIQTLKTLLVESPHLHGKNAEDFEFALSKENYDDLAVFLHKNAGSYRMLVQAVREMESAVASMKYGLCLTDQRPSGTVSMQQRFYGSYSTAQRSRNAPEKNKRVRGQPANQAATSAVTSFPSAAIGRSTTPAQITPIAQQSEQGINETDGGMQAMNELANASTPTRRQLFSSPSKRKTPNPKHQLTPVPDRDLLDEALKICSISPSDWDKRVSDSIVPGKIAAAINTARSNSAAPSPAKEFANCAAPEPEPEPVGETEAVVSGTMYQIGTNPDFFESLEQLFAPEYNDPDVSALEDDVNQFNQLPTAESDYILNDSGMPALEMVFNSSTASSTVNTSPTYKKILPKPNAVQNGQSPNKLSAKRKLFATRSLFTDCDASSREDPQQLKKNRLSSFNQQRVASSYGTLFDSAVNQSAEYQHAGTSSHWDSQQSGSSNARNAHSSPAAEELRGNGQRKTASVGTKRTQEVGQHRYPSADLITPDRVDALMKQLHKRN